MDKFSELKAAAMAATPGPWFVHEKHCEDGSYGIDTSDNEWTAEAVVWWGFARESIWREEDARFIAAANPAVVLALLAELEAKDKRIAELERANTSQDDHINQQQDRIESLEKKNGDVGRSLGAAEKLLATPVRLPPADSQGRYHGMMTRFAIKKAGFTVEGG